MKRKILFFDIDETLTSELDGKVPESAILAILAAQKNGHKVFINTGRCMQTVSEKIRKLPIDGFICGCGTAVYDGKGEEIWHYRMDFGKKEGAERAEKLNLESQLNEGNPYQISQLQQMAVYYQADLLLEGPEGMSLIPGGEELTRSFQFVMNLYQKQNYRFFAPDDPEFHYDKFTAGFRNYEDFLAMKQQIEDSYTGIDRGPNGDCWLGEFVPKGYDKASGISKVCYLFDIPEEDSFVFGDSNNDLPMFSGKGIKVVMGNSTSQELRAKADYITAKASENGIAKAMEHFGLV